MKKSLKLYAIVWAILLAVFNVICFVTPNLVTVKDTEFDKFGGAFWAGYVFITLAFIGQLACAFIALNTDSKTKLFYNIPIIRVSYTGLILTLIFGALCMAIPNLPNWVGIIVCLLILAFNAIAVVQAKAASDVVEKIDTKIKAKTAFIKMTTVDAQNLMAMAKSDAVKAACKKVYDALRFSDPMSNDALAMEETQIAVKMGEFTAAVSEDDTEKSTALADELATLIAMRNNKCKALK